MLTSSGGHSMLTVADRREGGGKICQNLADVICELVYKIPYRRARAWPSSR